MSARCGSRLFPLGRHHRVRALKGLLKPFVMSLAASFCLLACRRVASRSTVLSQRRAAAMMFPCVRKLTGATAAGAAAREEAVLAAREEAVLAALETVQEPSIARSLTALRRIRCVCARA